MSMDGMQNLAAAIVSHERIKLTSHDINGKQISVKYAYPILAVISCDHTRGIFTGSVNLMIEGEQYIKIEAFYNLWLAGWEPAPYEVEDFE